MKILNTLLTLAVLVLAHYLFLSLKQPYQPKAQGVELMDNEEPVKLQEIPAFKEKIFKNKQLFYASVEEKPGQKKAEFILLGISVGDRNLALIRDVVEKKDYYCTIGDRIGAFRVKQILIDKVVLEADGNTMEITQ